MTCLLPFFPIYPIAPYPLLFLLLVERLVERRVYPGKSVLGAVIIFVGAGVAMFRPMRHLFQAEAAIHGVDAKPYSGYDDDSLRGGSGDYAIVEGTGNFVWV